MRLDLRLNDLPLPRIATIQLVGATRNLQEITSRNLAKIVQGAESREFKNRKEKMKRRLINRRKTETFEQATEEVGRERLLISLYLEYTARSDALWLPPFDESIARSVLGPNGFEWHAGRRRQATQLFFTHFCQLPEAGLSRLCSLLLESYSRIDSDAPGPVGCWRQHRTALFGLAGDHEVARAANKQETLPLLMERFGVPKAGRFAECLRQVFLLKALKDAPFGKEIPALTEIEEVKTERASTSQLMGAAALQIMVQRVANEGGRKWSGAWPDWIIKLGCDPRHGRAIGEGSKWWGWATDDELRLAQQGITGLSLRFFIEFLRRSLEGTDKEPLFDVRAGFLLRLFEAGKIDSARLALNWATYQQLDRKYRAVLDVAHLSATTDDTSMICLKCVDGIFVIEGTHNFGLRMFHREFPIRNFWERPAQTYQDRDLRISPGKCPVFLPHDRAGHWVNKFFRHLRSDFHTEWDDVRI